MKRIHVKICGLTRVADVEAAVDSGADSIGFVFTASPRRISAELAHELGSVVPDGILRIGLFLDQQRDEIDKVLNSVTLDFLQFHGNETELECSIFGLPYLKSVAMRDEHSALEAEQNYPGAAGLLLDSHIAGKPGGSGKIFDWGLSRPLSKPLWLAGGLNVENIGQAIQLVRPYAVDVSSGVEASPGIKDPARIKAFIQAVRQQEMKLK